MGERRRRPAGRARGAARQQPAQSTLEVPHEERVDDGVHGAVAVAQPRDGVKKRQGDALAHRLREEQTSQFSSAGGPDSPDDNLY